MPGPSRPFREKSEDTLTFTPMITMNNPEHYSTRYSVSRIVKMLLLIFQAPSANADRISKIDSVLICTRLILAMVVRLLRMLAPNSRLPSSELKLTFRHIINLFSLNSTFYNYFYQRTRTLKIKFNLVFARGTITRVNAKHDL